METSTPITETTPGTLSGAPEQAEAVPHTANTMPPISADLQRKIVVLLAVPGRVDQGLSRIQGTSRGSIADILKQAHQMGPRQRGRLEHDVDSALHEENAQQPRHQKNLTWLS